MMPMMHSTHIAIDCVPYHNEPPVRLSPSDTDGADGHDRRHTFLLFKAGAFSLPVAPLAMPRQTLEIEAGWLGCGFIRGLGRGLSRMLTRLNPFASHGASRLRGR